MPVKIKIKEVARESGVNISIVSGVFNNGYGVNELTRECVVAVATRFNYRPNRLARGLVTGQIPEHRLLGVELIKRQSCQEARVQGPIVS
jgi:DNA-binding LacI/PurR family transcriptional regulator